MRLSLIYTDGTTYHSFTLDTTHYALSVMSLLIPGLRLVRVYRYA